MTYFAKSMDFLKFLKYIYVTIRVFMVVCMVEGMSYFMAPTKLVSVKVGMRHKILNVWFCIR
jgi:NADH:ubiquinone oxidoreductase subunit D